MGQTMRALDEHDQDALMGDVGNLSSALIEAAYRACSVEILCHGGGEMQGSMRYADSSGLSWQLVYCFKDQGLLIQLELAEDY